MTKPALPDFGHRAAPSAATRAAPGPAGLSARFVATAVAAAVFALCGLLGARPVLAAPPPVVAADTAGPRWNELSGPQRQALAPLSADWDGIDSRSKERWLDVAGRFPQMPADEQQRANQRMAEWSRMSPGQRTAARMNFQDSRNVSKEERQARWQAYQALPDDQKRELANRAIPPAPVPNQRRAPTPIDDMQPKSNRVDPIAAPRTPLDPGSSVLRTSPGATTTLMNRRNGGPAHQRDGEPKISAGPGYVDRTTLLPKRGPQAANGGNGNGNGNGRGGNKQGQRP